MEAQSDSHDAPNCFAKSKIQKVINEEINRALTSHEKRLEFLIERAEQLNGVDIDKSIQRIEAQMKIITKRAEAAFAYIDRTQKESTESTNRKRKSTAEELSKMMESTGNILKKVRFEETVVEKTKERSPPILSRQVHLNERPTSDMKNLLLSPPVLHPNGSLESTAEQSEEPQPNDGNIFENIEAKLQQIKEERLSPVKEINNPIVTQQKLFEPPPLPAIPFPTVLSIEAASYSMPKKLDLKIASIRNPTRLSVMWDVAKKEPSDPPMDCYTVYIAVEKERGSGHFPSWHAYDKVEAKPLPMCAMIKKYKPGYRICAAVVGKDKFGRYGPYSNIFSSVIPLQ